MIGMRVLEGTEQMKLEMNKCLAKIMSTIWLIRPKTMLHAYKY